MRFQISLRPYVTNPSFLSKDTVAELALLVKSQPHYRLHMDYLCFIRVRMLHT